MGSLAINNNARVNDLRPYFHRPQPTTAPLLRLNAAFADGTSISDPLVIYFDDRGKRIFDKDMDALKIMNSDPLAPNFYIDAPDVTKQSISTWPYLNDSTDVIPLGLKTKTGGMDYF